MKVNTESLMITLRYAGLMLLVLGLVFVIAIITPRLEKIVKKLFPKKPERVQEEKRPEKDVIGIYDAQIKCDEDYKEHNDKNGDVE